jgi:hypothetical protein
MRFWSGIADDAVMVFAREEDAKRVMEVLPKRFGKYGLTLHPEKTRLVSFQRPREPRRGTTSRADRPGTFDFLGFTHYWGKSWRGGWVVKRKTARSRLTRALQSLRVWLRRTLHLDIQDQHVELAQKVKGHYAYYGIIGNGRALKNSLDEVNRAWRAALGRRSNRAQMSWEEFNRFAERYPLPPVRIVHSTIPSVAKP